MRVDDFIVLGRTVPEESKTYGQSVCMAGYSPELRQLLRIYPLRVHSQIKARSILSVEVERNKKDSRFESWALKERDERQSVQVVDKEVDKEKLIPYFERHISESIVELNQKRLSLGVIKPDSYEVVLRSRENIKHPDQLCFFDDFKKSFDFKTANSYFTAPYIRITCGSSVQCIQIREWGVYELIRKAEIERKRLTPEYIRKALYLDENKDVFFVVGNMNQHRNNWLIIKSFSYKKKARQKSFFDDIGRAA